jgi:hypothetical protein
MINDRIIDVICSLTASQGLRHGETVYVTSVIVQILVTGEYEGCSIIPQYLPELAVRMEKLGFEHSAENLLIALSSFLMTNAE